MGPVTCPACGSDDLSVDTAAPPGRDKALLCEGCGHRWRRTARRSCPRCGSADIEEGVVDGWAYDDLEQAREDPTHAEWSYVDRVILRCLACRKMWDEVEGSRPYQPPS